MSFFGHSEPVSCGSFTNDGKLLITGSEDKSLKIWNLKDQKLIYTINDRKYHQGSITSIALSESRYLAVTTSDKNEVGIVNYESGKVKIYLICRIYLHLSLVMENVV